MRYEKKEMKGISFSPKVQRQCPVISVSENVCFTQGHIEDLFYRPTEKEIQMCQLDDGIIPVVNMLL